MTDQCTARTRGRHSLPRCCALLFFVIIGAFLPIGGWGYISYGMTGVIAALVAAGTCWMGGTLALISTAIASRGSTAAMWALLFGMLFRMGLPLAVGLALNRAGGPLASAGVFGMVLVFYLLILVVETPLSIKFLHHNQQQVSKAT